ncbi:hypothetical protein [Adhaeretor mobilis]|uniref:Uncharacterized protein n=1 Tax=Adhaeretor mobilis TaxID=1930276 RepID=A0A517MQL7_9BACT|nr:hypothetical protein [Adhaeretor mobilis]QDS97171.1 hypothetical protein HG15A2_04310 [Adhaeretor mobilis]
MSKSYPQPSSKLTPVLDEVVGYLNFSSGGSDPHFLENLSTLAAAIEHELEETQLGDAQSSETAMVDVLKSWLTDTVTRLQADGKAFRDASQATGIIGLLFDHFLPAYREFHRDLLHHQSTSDLWRPFFLGRAVEALLRQGGPWTGESLDHDDRIVTKALSQFNDYVGYRPTPALTSGNRSDPYPHEFVRPIPLYVRGAGVAAGTYAKLITKTLEVLRDTDPDILNRAWFDLERLEEVALDPRAYDFDHPVNRRPNHHFGQWDPRHIDGSGYYTRFVMQQVTLDALLVRVEAGRVEVDGESEQENRLDEAAAVLAGTILMASGTSGDSPGCHDSTVTLSTLLPHIAAYRDDFYEQLLASAEGERGERLREEAKKRRQPFGAARQHLNHELARRRAMQLQRVHLALLFARMGYQESALKQADSVRVASARMLTALYCRLTSGHDAIDAGRIDQVSDDLLKIEDLLHRGIECGALVDPWSVVGFAANFSLFPALENTVHDWRVDELIELVRQILDLAARAWSEAAAVDNSKHERLFESILQRLTQWWDQHATASVEGVDRLVAKEIEVSANLVSGALNAWHKAGAASGDIAFWQMFVAEFDSSKSFQLVIEALLDHGDTVASRALMMQWVNQRDHTPLDDGDAELRPLAFRWLSTLESQQHAAQDSSEQPAEAQDSSTVKDLWPQVAKFFAYLEANAEEYWQPPELMMNGSAMRPLSTDAIPFGDPNGDDDDLEPDDYGEDFDTGGLEGSLEGDLDEALGDPLEEGEYDYDYDEESSDEESYEYEEEEEVFGAAYEEMVYRDSTDDGIEGDIVDDGVEPLYTEWEYEADRIDQRLSFLNTVARLWKYTAITWGGNGEDRRETLDGWLHQTASNYRQLIELLESVHKYRFAKPSPSHEALIEYDRLRMIKEQLVQTIIGTSVETAVAARLLMASRLEETGSEGESSASKLFDSEIDAAAIPLLRAVLAGETEKVRNVWPNFLEAISKRPLLYVPHSRGGEPRKIVATRGLQRLLHDLLGWLPKLGLVREACELLDLAQQLEKDFPMESAVTEFDRLFENGYQAIVRSMVASAEVWDTRIPSERPRQADHMLVDALQMLTERQLDRWLGHSRTLRLSVVERLSEPSKWKEFVEFVERYGEQLFTQKFLGSLGNLRGILHQGVGQWISQLEENPEAVENILLLTDLAKGLPREPAEEMLSIALEVVVENYREYRDYNTTTTQSDHGELLYNFVDFIRLRAEYDRVAWNLKPVIWAHEILVRHGRTLAAEMWRQAFVQRTDDVAEDHAKRLVQMSEEYGMQLPTISDRLDERFIRPLLIDQVRALVGPAMGEEGEDRRAAFEGLEREISGLASQPHGAGFEAPDWLSALEDEVTEARSRMTHLSSSDRLARRIGQVQLTWGELLEQLSTKEV